jgi:hypothetical protein
MVIGQDWGPYSVLKQYISKFDISRKDNSVYYDSFIFNTFSSRTESFIFKTVTDMYKEKFNEEFRLRDWRNIFFTMAVLFTRQGNTFRGNDNFDERRSFEISYPYVKKQIDIVKPKLIIPLGNLAFNVVNRYFGLGYKETKIGKIINNLGSNGIIDLGDTKILPIYHPASHMDPKIQKDIWKRMWNS